MSTDVPEGAGPGPVGRRPRAGDGGAPASGALAIVLAIVAVVAGFLILRSINDDDDGDAGETPTDSIASSDSGTVTTIGSVTTVAVVTTTTEPALILDPAVTVIVANASNVNGSAAQMSRALASSATRWGSRPTRRPRRASSKRPSSTSILRYPTPNRSRVLSPGRSAGSIRSPLSPCPRRPSRASSAVPGCW